MVTNICFSIIGYIVPAPFGSAQVFCFLACSDDGHWPKLVSTDNKQKAHKNQNDAYFLRFTELVLPLECSIL